MKNQLIDLIYQKLNQSEVQLKEQFNQKHHIRVARFFTVDNLLPDEIAKEIYSSFPNANKMRLLNSSGELKLKYSYVKNEAMILQDLHHAFQSSRIISAIEKITGIQHQIADKSRLAGGISTLLKGHYINPHLDSSHDVDRVYYRTVNLLYYVSPNWKLENGGNYELWDEAVENRIIVPSLFNRLLVVETNRTSWHAVNPVVCDVPRSCVFNYYFSSESPEGEDYFHAASSLFNPLIKPRPEQKIRRAIFNFKYALFKKIHVF